MRKIINSNSNYSARDLCGINKNKFYISFYADNTYSIFVFRVCRFDFLKKYSFPILPLYPKRTNIGWLILK